MIWRLTVSKSAHKKLKKFPIEDRERIITAFDELTENPFQAIAQMRDYQDAAWRKRVGSYRILFDLNFEERLIEVQDIDRRTSKTYRRR